MVEQINREEIEKLVQATVDATVNELKKHNLFKTQSQAFLKTELILYNYIDYKMAIKNNEGIEKSKISYVGIIENALLKIKNDPYFNIIVHIYFEGKTIEEVAGALDLEPSTLKRNRNRLIDKLKMNFFPDEVIEELLLN